MTTLLIVIASLVLAVAGLGLGLWHLVGFYRHGRRAALPELVQPVPPRSYGPMVRLFDDRDLRFLQSQPGFLPGMRARLRLERRAVLSLYLRQALDDFRRSCEYFRTAAPHSDNAEFAPALVQQLLTFYLLYALLRVHCLLGLFVYIRTDVGGLLAILERQQQRVRQSVGRNSADLPVAAPH